ncbi:MAG: SurA N-terminal domain-containing protein [Colwellia sp.]
MLENIRESSQGVTAKIILGLIILTFAVAGIGSYTNTVDTSVATVNGQKISQAAFNKAYQAQRNRMVQQFGDMFETLSNDDNYMSNFRQGVLDNLINEVLIDQNNNSLAIRVSDERLKETIRNMPEFQVDGVFDNNRYLAMITQAGFFQSSDFRDYLRLEMTRRQLSQALLASEFNLPYQEEQQSKLQNQTRDIRYAVVSSEQFKATVEITEEAINAYYDANKMRFENKEQVKVDYITLNVNDIAKGIDVSESEVEDYYNANIANYSQAEQRRVSHILFESGEDAAAAKAKAEAALVRVEEGEEFASLAEELSDDTYSGENGGDLDYLEAGTMEEAFDQVAFSLSNVGDVSGVVETSFGYHLIKLTDIKAEVTQPLSEISADLLEKISTEKAQDKFYELQQEMARISFEYPDSLEDAANGVNVRVQTSQWLTKDGNQAPFDNAMVVEAAFSDLVLQDNVNSDLIEVNDDLAIVLRLNTYKEASTKPLVEVQDEIKTMLTAQKATEKAKETIDSLLNSFNAGEDITTKLAELNATFVVKANAARSGADLDQSISREAFTLPHPVEGSVSASSVSLSNGDLALVEVQSVNTNVVDANPALSRQQTSQLAQSAYMGYINSLKADAEIVRREIAEPVQTY